MTNKQEKISEILARVSGKDETPGPDESLFESGYIDSFALTDVVAELEKEFGITIPDSDLNPRRFETITLIENYVQSKQ